jgi:predicted nucleic acid-binding protein
MSAILLDTVTASEIRRGAKGDTGVWKWQQGIRSAWLGVISLNEIYYGIKKVARKDPVFAARLAAWYATIVAQPQRFRIAAVDRAIAEQAADFRAAHGIAFPDSLIAATAKVHGLTLATRNAADFQATGISLVNPWEYGT